MEKSNKAQGRKSAGGPDTRLEDYLKSARSEAVAATLRQRVGNWSVYAAATGSALAMATSASAGTVYYPGSPVTVSVTGSNGFSTQAVPFPAGHSFALKLYRDAGRDTFGGTTFRGGAVALDGGFGPGAPEFLFSGMAPKPLGPGSRVSAAAGTFDPTTGGRIAYKNILSGATVASSANHPGTPEFIGFRFNTATPSSPQYDYGWLEFVYTDDSHGVPDSLTFLAGAYNDEAGSAISTPTPEPGAAGLMLLALGAAGVTALRRRRDQTAQ